MFYIITPPEPAHKRVVSFQKSPFIQKAHRSVWYHFHIAVRVEHNCVDLRIIDDHKFADTVSYEQHLENVSSPTRVTAMTDLTILHSNVSSIHSLVNLLQMLGLVVVVEESTCVAFD